MVAVELKFNAKQVERLQSSFEKFVAQTRDPPLHKIFKQWALRYRSFAIERFDRQSKGGGDWPPLKPGTVSRRRQGKKRKGRAKKVAILVDTGTLRSALSPVFTGAPGQLEEVIVSGVRVGIGGPATHPDAGITIGKLAEIHHFGQGRIPARPIVVQPSAKVLNAMATDVTRELRSIARSHG